MGKKHSTQDLAEIKAQLLSQKKELEHEMGLVAEKDPHGGEEMEYAATYEDVGDEVDDNVHEIEQYQVNKSVEISLEKQLRDIDKALKSIDEGTYGICKYCKEPIPLDRLRVRPTSSSCVVCKKTLKDEV